MSSAFVLAPALVSVGHNCAMTEESSAAAQIRTWLLSVMELTGLTATAWSNKAGIAGSTIRRAVRPDYPFVTSSRTLSKLASAAGVAPPAIGAEPSPMEAPGSVVHLIPRAHLRPVGRAIPILGDVEAGAWREPLTFDVELPANASREALEAMGLDYVVADIPGYETAQLYALRVRGPSMNRHYPEGRFVIVAPAAEAGIRDGDHVIVRRNHAGLSETTIKELVVDETGRAQLWPRSDNPDHQAPLRWSRGDGQDRAQIIGVVVGDYGRRQRPERPAIFAPGEDDHAE